MVGFGLELTKGGQSFRVFTKLAGRAVRRTCGLSFSVKQDQEGKSSEQSRRGFGNDSEDGSCPPVRDDEDVVPGFKNRWGLSR